MQNLISHKQSGFELDLELARKRNFTRVAMALGGPVIFCFMVEDFYSGRFMVAVPLSVTLGLLIATYIYTKKSIGPTKEFIAYNLLLAAFISLIGFILWYIIAVEGHLSRTQWTYIYPILASFAMGRKLGFLWSIGFFLSVFLMTYFFGPFVHQDIQASLSEELMKRYYLAFLLVMGGIYYQANHVQSAFQCGKIYPRGWESERNGQFEIESGYKKRGEYKSPNVNR